jgi:hypothetical protein
MPETPDPTLAAVTDALRDLPLEHRVPGYGFGEIPGKAELLELLALPDAESVDCDLHGHDFTDNPDACLYCSATPAQVAAERSEANALARLRAREWALRTGETSVLDPSDFN